MSRMATAIVVLALASIAAALGASAGGQRAAGATVPSPKIAFVRYSLGAPWDSHIFVMNPDGSDLRQLTYGGGLDTDQTWSPDGSRLVFERWVQQGTDAPSGAIYVVRADGTGLRPLTSGPGTQFSPAWAPEGRRIAYVTGNGRLFAMNADGSGKRQLTDAPPGATSACCYGSTPTWSPDGQRIAYSRRGVIYMVNADGSAKWRLTRGHSYDCAAWSPDGSRIAFVEEPHAYNSIYVATPFHRGRERLITHHAYTEGGGFAWSPGGQKIVYAREKAGGVYIINVDGSHDRRLTRNPLRRDLLAGGFSWSPDRQAIAYASDRSGNGDIYVVNARWGNQQQLTDGLEADGAPRWSLSPRTESC